MTLYARAPRCGRAVRGELGAEAGRGLRLVRAGWPAAGTSPRARRRTSPGPVVDPDTSTTSPALTRDQALALMAAADTAHAARSVPVPPR